MDKGFLNKYFDGVAIKRISLVEVASKKKSNQHEFNGVSKLKSILGTEELNTTAHFLYVSDEMEYVKTCVDITWYDSRKHKPRSAEYRCYYSSNEVSLLVEPGDSLFFTKMKNGEIFVVFAKKDSLIESQLFWLFGADSNKGKDRFIIREDFEKNDASKVEFTARNILNEIGIDLPYDDETIQLKDLVIEKYGASGFPGTKEFSNFARRTVKHISPIEDPDDTLLKWYLREEALFNFLQEYLLQERIRNGFVNGEKVDVEGFINYAKSVINRRKSRAGKGFENQIEALLKKNKIVFVRNAKTENKASPDFLFPSEKLYMNELFPREKLTMLGAKTTAKDRWRQVLSEANNIEIKHLITMEGAISENQTQEMISKNLQLVVPKSIHATFTKNQKKWLWSVNDFITEVRKRQEFAKNHGYM